MTVPGTLPSRCVTPPVLDAGRKNGHPGRSSTSQLQLSSSSHCEFFHESAYTTTPGLILPIWFSTSFM
eukprot:12493426-Prorocentrum_lima.AAC.1